MNREEAIQTLSYYCISKVCIECPLNNPGLCKNENGPCTPWSDMRDERLQACLNAIDKQSPPDNVNHPQHYELPGGLECFDVIVATQGVEAAKHFCLCNAMKYLFRSQRKNGAEDIEKARWYLNKHHDLVEGEGDSNDD